jgi:hypothetical protein
MNATVPLKSGSPAQHEDHGEQEPSEESGCIVLGDIALLPLLAGAGSRRDLTLLGYLGFK